MADSSTADWIVAQSHRHPLLTAAEEIELARQIQDWLKLKDKKDLTRQERAAVRRGKRAYDRFFCGNIRLAVSIANRYTRRGGNLLAEDLIQEGILGLHRAIEKYDPTSGYKFSTYAYWWIRQAIHRSINSKGKTIRLPEHAYRYLRIASEFVAEYEMEHRRRPPIDLVAKAAGLQTETLKCFMRYAGPVVSLDEKASAITGTNGGTFLDIVAAETPEPSIVDELEGTVTVMLKAMANLNETQQEVLRRRYLEMDQATYQQIATDHGVSRERIRQVHDNTLRIMRNRLSNLGYSLNAAPALKCA